jgi:hypothetical protein
MHPALELLAAIVGALLVVHLLIHRRMPKLTKGGSGCGCASLALVSVVMLASIAVGPIGRQPHLEENMMMQACRTIALAEFQYANDNDGNYPSGASSTEVFQKLLDGNYISDPTVFFVPMPHKLAAKGTHLTPQNVCYDVTAAVDRDSPDGLPLVFLTGFRVEYKPGGSAISLVKPFPVYYQQTPEWLNLFEGSLKSFDGLPVAYKSNNAYYRVSRSREDGSLKIGPGGFGVVSDVLSPAFDARGVTYRQLTPDGILK